MDTPDFYLSSSEGYGMGEPRACWRIKRLHSDSRDDLLLICVSPPLIGQRYGLGGRDLDTLIVAPRFRGDSLFPIRKWPVFVHVARSLAGSPELREEIKDTEMESIAWAELYQTEEDARLKKM